MEHLEEPLLESAPLARRLAAQLCKDPETGRDCSPMHGVWQYLRLLGLVTTPADHRDFIKDAFAEAAPANEQIKVLISGAVDYSMQAHVLWACGLCRADPNITVVDVCDTPLWLNDWYARRLGRSIDGIRQDVRAYIADAPYDVVCTHSFLSQIPASDRPTLLARWRQLLRPGGRVITVNRIRAGSDAGPFTYSDAQIKALREAVLVRAGQWHDRLDLGPGELADNAVLYARQRRIFPVSSPDAIAALFTQAGFALDHLSSAAATPGPLHSSAASTEAVYAKVVARRP